MEILLPSAAVSLTAWSLQLLEFIGSDWAIESEDSRGELGFPASVTSVTVIDGGDMTGGISLWTPPKEGVLIHSG
jgi:hypothetical protein